MATDFFERQDAARRQTTILVVGFALALVTLTSLVYLLTFGLFASSADPRDPPPPLWNPQLFVAVLGGVSAVVGGSSLVRIAQLASGGKAVALMLNGREIPGTSVEPRQRQLLNVVEEMAIASGVPVPPVFLLPDEAGINAFAAGHAPGDAVVAVSQGCLDYLTRDELQGVVAHEFSHILNGDMRMSLRLAGLVYGILALSQIGWLLMRVTDNSSSSRDRDDNKNATGIFLLGLGLYLLGLGGAFFGWLIQAAISRQREFLADASAVQFTRNPEGIAGALKKIGGLDVGSRVDDPHAGEFSHLFLADAFCGRRWTDLLATHPPLEERIRRLDPQFDGRFAPVLPLAEADVERPAQNRPPLKVPGIGQAILASAASSLAVAQVGRVEPQHLTYAADLSFDIPPLLREAAREPFNARALVYCLLLDSRPNYRNAQLDQIRQYADPRDVDTVLRLAKPVHELSDAARLPLIDLALPALRQMSPQQHQVFRDQVKALIEADQQTTLFEYALHCMLRRYLYADSKTKRSAARWTAPIQVAEPVVQLLSLLAWEGQPEGDQDVEPAFVAGLSAFLGHADGHYRLLARDQCSLRAFDTSLRTLADAAPDVKRQVVAACAACIVTDRQVTVREYELLRAISASLDCPMPPLTADDV
jgi:Zn-dependent protease with chaperone function